MSEGRTKKAIRNSKYAVYYKIIETVLAFVLRTVFVHTLSTVYLGLNGVFTNVLTVLSLMDLGLGSAIAFSLYQPLADNDDSKIRMLMLLYKKLYRNVGLVICGIGFCLTPALKFIITLPEEIPHIYLIYWLNIGNTAVTYFLAYKRTILIADQKSYINYKNDIIFKISRCLLLSLILLFTHNFILYLGLDILNTLISNIFISRKVSRIYPFLSLDTKDKLEKEEKNKLWKFMKAGLLNKVGQTVVSSTDNLIISTYISTLIVGYYSNYLMIISGIETLTYLLFSNITASVGNLAASKDSSKNKIRSVFINIQTYNHIFSTIVCVGLSALLNPFMELWVGKDLLLSQSTVFVIVLNLYITLTLHGVSNFMGAKGEIFYYNRYRPLIEAIVNLVVSIIIVKNTNLGINGVFIGTTVSFLCGRVWMDAYNLYKNWFDEPFYDYIVDYTKKFGITCFLSITSYYICNIITSAIGINVLIFAALMIMIILFSLVVLYAIYRKSDAIHYMCDMVRKRMY